MLGRGREVNGWQWAARGKHPAVRDFFSLDQGHPLHRALSAWAEKGYGILSENQNFISTAYSWRFWARGVRKNMLVSGLVKDSCDFIGRPYPLFLMGVGTLKGWEDHWDLVPLACEGVWSQAEYIAAKRHRDLETLREDLRFLKTPQARWSEMATARGGPWRDGSRCEKAPDDTGGLDIRSGVARLKGQGHLLVALGAKTFQDQSELIDLWHFHLKSEFDAVPNAVFMGGGPNQAYLAVFMRALAPADFVSLWSV